mgnify:CR=1 FL=1
MLIPASIIQRSDVSKVERPAKAGDFVLMNVSGQENNKELENFNYQDFLYEMGSNSLTPVLDSKLEGVSIIPISPTPARVRNSAHYNQF